MLQFPLSRIAALTTLFFLTTTADAQTVSGLQGFHRDGQSYLTWNELAGTNQRYRVYRSDAPIRSAANLNFAVELGEVDDRSSDNRPRSGASGGANINWIIQPGGTQLADSVGLYVHTLRNVGTSTGHYAVMAVQGGTETRVISAGQNTTSISAESAAPPQPVLQLVNGNVEIFAHWTSHVDTPFQPALSILPSHGHNFIFEPGTTPGPRGLLVRLHAAGQQYTIGWPHRFEVQSDVDILALSDAFPGGAWTLWIGAQEAYPKATTNPNAQVHFVTLRRVMWTTDWIAARLGVGHDPDRLYAAGGSMGAMGSYYLATEYPDRFAAILARNANFNLTARDVNNIAFIEGLFGGFGLNLTIAAGTPSAGLRVYDRLNASAIPPFQLNAPGPIIRTINGRNDTTVGWSSAPELYTALAAIYQPAVHYFDERSHNPFGFWQGVERALLARTFATHRDRPSLHFSRLTLDDNAGSGLSANGDPVGCLSCYIDYDLQTARADTLSCQFDVFLRNQGALDDAPLGTAQVVLTPGRTAPFALEPGAAVMFTLSESNVVLDSQILIADGSGRVHTAAVPISLAPRRALFQRLDTPTNLPRVDSFSASSTLITAGDPVTLSWMTTNANVVNLDNGIGAVALDGSRSVNPTVTTSYVLTASGAGASASSSVTVTVSGGGPAAPTIDSFSASPSSLNTGESTRLAWTTTGASSVSIRGIGGVAVDGNRLVAPTATMSYVLTATGAGGTTTATVTVTVTIPEGPVLGVEVTGLPTSVNRGDDQSMVVSITNSGTQASENLTASVDVTGTGEIELRDPRSSTQNVAAIAAGTSRNASWTVRTRKEGNVTLTINVTNASGQLVGTVTKTMAIQN